MRISDWSSDVCASDLRVKQRIALQQSAAALQAGVSVHCLLGIADAKRDGMKIPLSLLAILALGACQSAPGSRTADDVPSTQTPGPGGSGRSYNALGTEPFWALQIENGKMTFQTPHRPTGIAHPITDGPTFNAWRYTSDPSWVDINLPMFTVGFH